MKKLHQLIKSLSQSEKRFVKIRLKGSKSGSSLSNHFDALVKLKEYKFEDVLSVEKKSVKLTQSNLSLLYEVTLKHLRSYKSTKSIGHNLRGDLVDIKTLMDKGLVDDAKVNCVKLIKRSKAREEFEVLKVAYKELWNIYLLRGDINPETTDEIQKSLKETIKKEAEIISLEEIYREATTIYYQYFFQKRDSKFQDQIKKVTANLEKKHVDSAKANHIFFEIKSIEQVVLGAIEEHHVIRQQQLLHLVSSSVFEQDSLIRLMVLSNVFVFLKSKARINELSAYLEFMESYFKPELDKKIDSVFMEKYYDIYFLNQCFLLVWAPDSEKIFELTDLFKKVISKNYLTNTLLIGRIYLSIIELYVLTANYKLAIPLLVNFFNLSKKSKYSKHYIEGDLHFLVANYLMGKMDTFDNSLEALNRKVRRNELELNQDQATLLELLNSIVKEDQKDIGFYLEQLKHRQTYKIYVYKLMTRDSVEVIRSKHFPIADTGYNSNNDELLKSLSSYTKE